MALFGIPSPKPQKNETAPAATDAAIFDVATADFETRVIAASLEKPVLVDFWAPWCGPCKQLMPVLEAEVTAANGAVLLAKVNIDDNPELAQALRIQSVPTVMAFFQGQPVTAFSGARPAGDIRKLIDQLAKIARSARPDALDIPAALKEAEAFAASGDTMQAQDIYMHILAQDQGNIAAYNGMVRVLIAVGAVEEARGLIDNAPEQIAKNPAFAEARTALSLADRSGEALQNLKPLLTKVEQNPDDSQMRFDLAAAQFGAGQKAEAVDTLLHIVKHDRVWNDDAARKELLRFFEAMGFADPVSVEGRKKLSRLLFS